MDEDKFGALVFQFTPLREGRREPDVEVVDAEAFQFTPLREGRLDISAEINSEGISIHAPPRGATTGQKVTVAECTSISIHAPPRGATRYSALRRTRETYFNSRPSARGDANRHEREAAMRFQFTPLREGRPDLLRNRDLLHLFQFTPLREGRHTFVPNGYNVKLFQFTPLREGRPPLCHGVAVGGEYFNSRPSARGDAMARSDVPSQLHFNSRPSARGDSSSLIPRWTMAHFNSRPSARGDSKRYAISANLLFNPYKSAWLNNRARQFVEIILVIFHRIIA